MAQYPENLVKDYFYNWLTKLKANSPVNSIAVILSHVSREGEKWLRDYLSMHSLFWVWNSASLWKTFLGIVEQVWFMHVVYSGLYNVLINLFSSTKKLGLYSIYTVTCGWFLSHLL